MTNKLQPLPSYVPGKSNMGCGDYLMILVLQEHGLVIFAYIRFIEKFHELTGLCSRPNLNQTWCSVLYFIETDVCVCYMTLNEKLMSYSMSSWIWFSMYLCWEGYYDKDSTKFF